MNESKDSKGSKDNKGLSTTKFKLFNSKNRQSQKNAKNQEENFIKFHFFIGNNADKDSTSDNNSESEMTPEIYKKCVEITKKLYKTPYSAFARDENEFCTKLYLKKFPKAMTLKKVRDNLEINKYKSFNEWETDVILTWKHAFKKFDKNDEDEKRFHQAELKLKSKYTKYLKQEEMSEEDFWTERLQNVRNDFNKAQKALLNIKKKQ